MTIIHERILSRDDQVSKAIDWLVGEFRQEPESIVYNAAGYFVLDERWFVAAPTSRQSGQLKGSGLSGDALTISERIAEALGDAVNHDPVQEEMRRLVVGRFNRLVLTDENQLQFDMRGVILRNLIELENNRVRLMALDEVPDYPQEIVIDRATLLSNLQNGMRTLGVETGEVDLLINLSPVEMGFASLVAMNATVDIDQHGRVVVHPGRDENGMLLSLPPELGFRHIGLGPAIIESAVLPYYLLRKYIQPNFAGEVAGIDDNRTRLAERVLTGEFQERMRNLAASIFSAEEQELYNKECKRGYQDSELVRCMRDQRKALQGLLEIDKAKEATEKREQNRRAKEAELQLEIVKLDESPGLLNVEKWPDAQARTNAQREKIAQLRQELDEIKPVDFAERTRQLVLNLFNADQHDIAKKVIISERPTEIEQSNVVLKRIRDIFGNLLEDVLAVCAGRQITIKIFDINTELEAVQAWFEEKDNVDKLLVNLEDKKQLSDNIKLMLSLLGSNSRKNQSRA